MYVLPINFFYRLFIFYKLKSVYSEINYWPKYVKPFHWNIWLCLFIYIVLFTLLDTLIYICDTRSFTFKCTFVSFITAFCSMLGAICQQGEISIYINKTMPWHSNRQCTDQTAGPKGTKNSLRHSRTLLRVIGIRQCIQIQIFECTRCFCFSSSFLRADAYQKLMVKRVTKASG